MSQAENQIIPESWSNTNIGDFAPLQRGFDLPNRERIDGIYPVVYSNGVMNFHNTYQVRGPGVITGRSGTIGKVHYVDEDYWPHNTALWVKQFNNAVPKYVYYLYSYLGFDRFSSGSGVPTLNRNDAHSFAITVPSQKEEQTAIANALSDVDALLTELANLIAKKQAIKTATMQQLLTGKTRLPQFATHTEGEKKGQPKGTKPSELGEIPEDWDIRLLDEITVISRLAGAEYTSFWQEELTGEIIALRGFNIGRNRIIDRELIRISNTLSMKLKRSRLTKGDVIYPCVGSIGNAAVIYEDNKYHIQQNIARITPSKSQLHSEFLCFYLMSELAAKEVERFTATTSQPSVLVSSLRQYRVPIPKRLKEQTAIANILTDMDYEIQSLEQRLAKTRQIKQGMMQELLTGKTRLPF